MPDSGKRPKEENQFFIGGGGNSKEKDIRRDAGSRAMYQLRKTEFSAGIWDMSIVPRQAEQDQARKQCVSQENRNMRPVWKEYGGTE